MTHEITPDSEAPNGPEHDHDLPDADEIPGDLTAEGSGMPTIHEDI